MPNLFETLVDIREGLQDGLSQAVTDISQAADQIFDDTWNNLVMRVDDILLDTWSAITKVPKAVLDGVRYMLRDPKFWYGLMAFYGLAALGSGLAASQAAAPGMRMVAFREAAGLAWGRLGAGFLTKAHKLTYLVSPKYRESFTELMADAPQQMFEAGMDIMSFVQLVGDVGGLVQSFRALRGQDINVFQDSWHSHLSNIGSQGTALFNQWGDDPNKFIDWVDKNILYDEHNAAAEFMRNMGERIDNFANKSNEILGRVNNVRGSLTKVGKSVDRVFGTNVSEGLEKDLSKLDEVILTPWRETNKLLNQTADALEVRILAKEKDDKQGAAIFALGQSRDSNAAAFENIELAQFIEAQKAGKK